MPSLFPAPNEQNIEAFLGGLVSNGTHVVGVPSPEPVREPTGLIAEYATDADSLAVVAFADHDVVNFVGGPSRPSRPGQSRRSASERHWTTGRW
jgi:hypothetical protein